MRKKQKARNPKGKTAPTFPKEFKLRVVQLYLEEGYSSPFPTTWVIKNLLC